MINGQKFDKINIIPVPGIKSCRSRESGILENEKNLIPGKRDSRLVKKKCSREIFREKKVEIPGREFPGGISSSVAVIDLEEKNKKSNKL